MQCTKHNRMCSIGSKRKQRIEALVCKPRTCKMCSWTKWLLSRQCRGPIDLNKKMHLSLQRQGWMLFLVWWGFTGKLCQAEILLALITFLRNRGLDLSCEIASRQSGHLLETVHSKSSFLLVLGIWVYVVDDTAVKNVGVRMFGGWWQHQFRGWVCCSC